MPVPNFILLYVAEPAASAAFYENLMGRAPVEASPTFVMFALDGGMMLGLWGRAGVLPAATAPGGGEIAFAVESPDGVDEAHRDWAARGIAIAQAPVDMDFGRTFTALDPDGHRLRVFAPGGN
jgi:catechol 2,3-dioxygenase-like lactoylglutathione lyase family enzyme